MKDDLSRMQRLLRRALFQIRLDMLIWLDNTERIMLWFGYGSKPLNIPCRLWALLALILSIDSFMVGGAWATTALWEAVVSSSMAETFFVYTRRNMSQ
ncbi:MAG: hypothetical protein ACYC6R_16145 [Anaerolineales bacterium]